MNERLFMFAKEFCSYFIDFIVAVPTDELREKSLRTTHFLLAVPC